MTTSPDSSPLDRTGLDGAAPSRSPLDRAGLDRDACRTVLAAVFTEHAARARLPSIAWGLVDRGAVVVSGGGGPDAVYRIASMTKSFTAAVVLSLRDEGRLRLDDPIATLAPELARVTGPTADSPAITIRHLLTMSSGLATDDPWADRHMDVGDDELDRWVAGGVTSAAAPGTIFEYSNLGYGLLGRVVKRVTGRSVQELVTERLLVPLGMTATSWTAPAGATVGYRRRPIDRPPDGVGEALADDALDDAPTDELVLEPWLADGAIAPMGGLFSTVADLARWIGFLTDAFPARDDPDSGPLSRASRREMQQVHRAFTDNVGGYGMGLNVIRHPTLGTVVTHSGGLPGFGSNMRWLPEQGIGLVALANVTYARMATATAQALEALATADLIGPSSVPVTSTLARAAEVLVGLFNEWDEAAAAAVFADNVYLDSEAPARRAAALALRDEHGPFTLARVVAESATAAIAVAHGPHAEVRIDFQLTPTVPPLVQHYDTTIDR